MLTKLRRIGALLACTTALMLYGAILVPASASATDYCGGRASSWVPEYWGRADFRGACQRHDYCYSRNSWTNRKTCDLRLGDDMNTACRQAYSRWSLKRGLCFDRSDAYYIGVRLGASTHYHGHGLNN